MFSFCVLQKKVIWVQNMRVSKIFFFFFMRMFSFRRKLKLLCQHFALLTKVIGSHEREADHRSFTDRDAHMQSSLQICFALLKEDENPLIKVNGEPIEIVLTPATDCRPLWKCNLRDLCVRMFVCIAPASPFCHDQVKTGSSHDLLKRVRCNLNADN